MTARAAVADVVVLRDRTRLTGTVANREAIARNAGAVRLVSILVASSLPDSFELVRIPADRIRYVVLEDGSRKAVYDLSAFGPGTGSWSRDKVPSRPQPIPFSSIRSPDVPHRPTSFVHESGVVLAVTGIVLFSAGLLVYAAGSGDDWNGDALRGPQSVMLGGAAMTAVGAFMVALPQKSSYVGVTTRF
jgi:hypothetical protein